MTDVIQFTSAANHGGALKSGRTIPAKHVYSVRLDNDRFIEDPPEAPSEQAVGPQLQSVAPTENPYSRRVLYHTKGVDTLMTFPPFEVSQLDCRVTPSLHALSGAQLEWRPKPPLSL